MYKTKQRPVPAIEFSNDTMMRELHEIRIKIYSETKDMNEKDLKEYFQRKSKEFRKTTDI